MSRVPLASVLDPRGSSQTKDEMLRNMYAEAYPKLKTSMVVKRPGLIPSSANIPNYGSGQGLFSFTNFSGSSTIAEVINDTLFLAGGLNVTVVFPSRQVPYDTFSDFTKGTLAIGPYYSVDWGLNFSDSTAIHGAMVATSNYSIAYMWNDANNAYIAVSRPIGAPPVIVQTIPITQGWEIKYDIIYTGTNYLAFSRQQQGLSIGSLTIYLADDYGNNWHSYLLPMGSEVGVSFPSLHPFQGNKKGTVAAALYNQGMYPNQLYVSNDGGITFNTVDYPTANVGAVLAANDNYFLIDTGVYGYALTKLQGDIQPITLPGTVIHQSRWNFFGYKDYFVFIPDYGNNGGNVYLTQDGITWTKILNRPSAGYYVILSGYEDHLVIGYPNMNYSIVGNTFFGDYMVL